MSLVVNPIDPTIKKADTLPEEAKKTESGWSGRKIALAVLGTIAAIASIVGTVFLVMMLTKKKEEASLEGETAPPLLTGAKEGEKTVQEELALSKEEKTEEKKSAPTANLFHPQKTKPVVKHRPPSRTVKNIGTDKTVSEGKKQELSLSQFIEIPIKPEANTAKDFEVALKLQQELDSVPVKPAEDTSMDEAIARALSEEVQTAKPKATKESKKTHHVHRPSQKLTFVLPEGVTKENYASWALIQARENWAKAH